MGQTGLHNEHRAGCRQRSGWCREDSLCGPEFPDGQLFISLRGAQTDAVTRGEALGRALRALGVADAHMSRDIGAAHALAGDCDAAHDAWRSALVTFCGLGTREAAELPTWRRQWRCHCDQSAFDPDLPAR